MVLLVKSFVCLRLLNVFASLLGFPLPCLGTRWQCPRIKTSSCSRLRINQHSALDLVWKEPPRNPSPPGLHQWECNMNSHLSSHDRHGQGDNTDPWMQPVDSHTFQIIDTFVISLETKIAFLWEQAKKTHGSNRCNPFLLTRNKDSTLLAVFAIFRTFDMGLGKFPKISPERIQVRFSTSYVEVITV